MRQVCVLGSRRGKRGQEQGMACQSPQEDWGATSSPAAPGGEEALSSRSSNVLSLASKIWVGDNKSTAWWLRDKQAGQEACTSPCSAT